MINNCIEDLLDEKTEGFRFRDPLYANKSTEIADLHLSWNTFPAYNDDPKSNPYPNDLSCI